MAKAKNAEVQTVTNEDVATVEVKDGTVNVVTPKERAEAVSGDTFRAFMNSPEVPTLTVEQAAEKLGMNKLTFSQRLNTLRKDRKNLIKYLTDKGQVDEAKAVPEIQKLKDGRVGRSGGKQELNANQRALMAFVQSK